MSGGRAWRLAFAIRAKRSDPSRQIEVYNRTPASATYGFGVVLSDEAKGAIADLDPEVTRRSSETAPVGPR